MERTYGLCKIHGTNTQIRSPQECEQGNNITEGPRSSGSASSLSDMKVDGEQIEEEASKPRAAFVKIA